MSKEIRENRTAHGVATACMCLMAALALLCTSCSPYIRDKQGRLALKDPSQLLNFKNNLDSIELLRYHPQQQQLTFAFKGEMHVVRSISKFQRHDGSYVLFQGQDVFFTLAPRRMSLHKIRPGSLKFKVSHKLVKVKKSWRLRFGAVESQQCEVYSLKKPSGKKKELWANLWADAQKIKDEPCQFRDLNTMSGGYSCSVVLGGASLREETDSSTRCGFQLPSLLELEIRRKPPTSLTNAAIKTEAHKRWLAWLRQKGLMKNGRIKMSVLSSSYRMLILKKKAKHFREQVKKESKGQRRNLSQTLVADRLLPRLKSYSLAKFMLTTSQSHSSQVDLSKTAFFLAEVEKLAGIFAYRGKWSKVLQCLSHIPKKRVKPLREQLHQRYLQMQGSNIETVLGEDSDKASIPKARALWKKVAWESNSQEKTKYDHMIRQHSIKRVEKPLKQGKLLVALAALANVEDTAAKTRLATQIHEKSKQRIELLGKDFERAFVFVGGVLKTSGSSLSSERRKFYEEQKAKLDGKFGKATLKKKSISTCEAYLLFSPNGAHAVKVKALLQKLKVKAEKERLRKKREEETLLKMEREDMFSHMISQILRGKRAVRYYLRVRPSRGRVMQRQLSRGARQACIQRNALRRKYGRKMFRLYAKKHCKDNYPITVHSVNSTVSVRECVRAYMGNCR